MPLNNKTMYDFGSSLVEKDFSLKRSHSCNSNRELKYADLLGEVGFSQFENLMLSFFGVNSLKCIDIWSPKFFDTWTIDSKEIQKIKEICETFSRVIKGKNISFEYTKCRYNKTVFMIGTWNNSTSEKVKSRYPKCVFYCMKDNDFQSIYDEVLNGDL